MTPFFTLDMAVLLDFSAGAEEPDKQVHQQHRAVGDDNQDGGKRAGDGVGALLRKLVDLHGDEQELGRHQQDDGGDGGDGADKGGDKAAEEGVLDKWQRHSHKDLEAVRAHVVGRLLNGLVDLPQGGDAAAGARGQGADHKDDNQDGRAAVDALQKPGVEHAAGEAPDVPHAQHRAGHGHGQHGHGLNEALGLEPALDHQIGDNHGEQGRDGGGDEAEDKGVPEGPQALVFGEHLTEPLEGQGGELVPPGGEQGPDGHAGVHHDDEEGRQGAQDGQGDGDAPVLNEHPAPGCLARQELNRVHRCATRDSRLFR